MRYRKANHTETIDPRVDKSLTDRAREAERILGQSLDAAKGEAPGPVTSFAILRTLVESRTRRHASSKESRFMSAIKHPLITHRKLSFGIVFAVLVFALATLVPFEYQRTIGYQATFAGIDPAAGLNLARLENALGALGYDDAEFGLHATSSGVTCQISGLPSLYAVSEVSAAMAGMAGFDGEPDVAPMIETVSGSLYAQVKCELGDFDDFDFKGKTDEEIKAEIEKRLAARGCTDVTVQVISQGDAGTGEQRQIMVKIKDGSGDKENDLCSNLFLDDIGFDDTTKTDQELEQEVQKRLTSTGKPNAEVSVTTQADGKRRIEIKCKPD
jgi:hypothetical protein